MTVRRWTALSAVTSMLVVAATGYFGVGSLLSLLSGALFARYVYADEEITMLSAVLVSVVPAAAFAGSQPTGALGLFLGTFIAAEIAAAGARVRHSGSQTAVKPALATLGRHAGFAAVIAVAGRLTTGDRLPDAVAVTAEVLLVLVLVAAVVWFSTQRRTGS